MTTTDTARPVLVEYEDGVQIVTINRPEVRNAINTAAARGIADAMAELDERDDLVAGVITEPIPTCSANRGIDRLVLRQIGEPSIR